MKNNLLRTVSDWLLATSVILSAILFMQFYFRSHEMRAVNAELQNDVAKLQEFRARVNLLMAEVMEYSKQHPAINPLLESVGAKPPSNPAPAPAAAPKPPAK